MAGRASALLLPAGIRRPQLDRALKECEEIAARDRSNLYRTSQFFEDRVRYDAFVAMYAVMRLIDDTIDRAPDGRRRADLEAELDRWKARIRAACDGCPSDDALDVALAAAALTFPLPVKLWSDFLDAMRFEVRHSGFSDFNEFLTYAEGAAVAPTAIYVYLLASSRDRSGHYLVDEFDFHACGRQLGLFAYLTHILRDVASDMRADRKGLVYLSREDLRRHRLSEPALRRLIEKGVDDERWRALVKDLCQRAHALEARGTAMAEAQYARMPRDCAFILCLIIRVYSDLLQRIEAAPDEVLRGPGPTPPREAVLVSAANQTAYPLSRVLEKGTRATAR